MPIENEDQVDMNQNELLNARLQQLGVDPSSLVEGLIWNRNDLHRIRFFDGSAVQSVAWLSDIVGMVKTGFEGEVFVPDIQVRCASTANIAALSGLLTIDGIVLVAGDLVLAKNQSTVAQNGVYVAKSTAWTRANGYDTDAEIRRRIVVVSADGTTNKMGYAYVVTNTAAITIGTTNITYAQIPIGIGTGATSAAAGNHSHTSIATTAASSIGQALRMRFTNRTATATTATSDLWVVFNGSTAGQTETMYAGTAVSNNSGYWVRYSNKASVSWSLAPAASNTIDGVAAAITIPAGYTVDMFNVALNQWIVLFVGKIGLVTKSDVGLGNCDNTSDANKPISTATATALSGKLSTALKGAANGLAELDATGKVPSAQLPSGLALGEVSTTAYRGDRGKTAYDHSQATGNPHGTTKSHVGLGAVDNTSDMDKPVSTAQAAAMDLLEPLHTRSNITAATDFHTLDVGTYRISGGTWHANNPGIPYNWGVLQVEWKSSSERILTYVADVVTASGSSGIWVESCFGGTWRGWSHLASEAYNNTIYELAPSHVNRASNGAYTIPNGTTSITGQLTSGSTWTLPANPKTGTPITVLNISASEAVTLVRNTGQAVQSGSNLTVSAQSRRVAVYDGTAWTVI